MNLAAFLDRYRTAVTEAVIRTYPPFYDEKTRQAGEFDLRRLLRRPLGAQADAIRATAFSLRRHRGTLVVGEMGTGKTTITAAAAYLAGFKRILVLCPPHLVRKWGREVRETVSGAHVAVVRRISDLERLRSGDEKIQFVICSREQAKLGYRWMPAVVARPARDADGRLAYDEYGAVVRLPCCPTCFAPALDDEEVPLGLAELAAKRRRCRGCGGPLWQADRRGPRRYPLADYIRRRMPGYFDLLVLDEVQEFKARGSAQGLAAGTLAAACGTTLALTGTVFGGYSSTLFYLLWRFSPAVRREFGYREEGKWVSRYGIVERITKKDPDAHTGDGRHSKRRSYLARTVEKPGVSPAVLFHLIGNTVFLRLADVARDLPAYCERVMTYALGEGEGPDAPSQAGCYRRLAQDLSAAVAGALQGGSKRLLATYIQALLAYPDACTRGETVLDPDTGDVIAHAPPLPWDALYPKERALLDLVSRERARGRRVLVYITHTERRDLSPRLRAILEGADLRVAVLKADTVPPDRREAWVGARVAEGIDVLLCHPRLVQTGLDLIDFPSIVWYETEYSVYVLRQASRRSWRIGQREPVEVTYLVYEDTLQAEALALVAAKLRAALLVDGELPEDGLAALEGDGQDLFVTLARRLVDGDGGESRSLEALFTQRQAIEAAGGAYLVDDSWEVPAGSAASRDGSDPGSAGVWELAGGALPTDTVLSTAGPSMTRPRESSFGGPADSGRRPMPRRKPVPAGQLRLFDE